MVKGEFKQILFEIFDVLGFSDTEKSKATESFKKKLAPELLKELRGKLPQEQQTWIDELQTQSPSPTDPKILQIQNTISQLYSEEELNERSKTVFKRILKDYIVFMSSGLEPEQVSKLNDILTRI